jgi:hypothetical protein
MPMVAAKIPIPIAKVSTNRPPRHSDAAWRAASMPRAQIYFKNGKGEQVLRER